MDLKVSHGYVYRCKVMSENYLETRMNQTDEQREQIILETSRTVSAVRDNNAGLRGEMSDLKNGDSLCECSLTT